MAAGSAESAYRSLRIGGVERGAVRATTSNELPILCAAPWGNGASGAAHPRATCRSPPRGVTGARSRERSRPLMERGGTVTSGPPPDAGQVDAEHRKEPPARICHCASPPCADKAEIATAIHPPREAAPGVGVSISCAHAPSRLCRSKLLDCAGAGGRRRAMVASHCARRVARRDPIRPIRAPARHRAEHPRSTIENTHRCGRTRATSLQRATGAVRVCPDASRQRPVPGHRRDHAVG